MFSGGVASWAAAKRVAARYGTENLTLLFSDTLGEDEDLYRFLTEAAANVGGDLVILTEGRTIWQVFRDERFLGNSRVDPCSKILKRQILDKWLEDNCDPEDTMIAMGFDWSESHRMDRMKGHDEKWLRWAPLLSQPYLDKPRLLAFCRAEGLLPPRLYDMGFQHNNCGGGCVKAGQAAFLHLLKVMPHRFAVWESEEQAMRDFLGRQDVAILTDRSHKERRPLTLRELRETFQSGNAGQMSMLDMEDWGSCGCFQVEEEQAPAGEEVTP